jgi:sulfite exporter TauE/SafE
MAIGAAFGSAGSMALEAAALLPVQRSLYVVGNVFLVLLGASLVLGPGGITSLQRGGARVFGMLLPRLQPLLRRPGFVGRTVLGLVWGLMPCGLVYSVLPLALMAGGAWQGAMVMLTFGLATTPSLLATGVFTGRGSRLLRGTGPRRVGAALLIVFGVAGIWRIATVPDAFAQGALCVGPW